MTLATVKKAKPVAKSSAKAVAKHVKGKALPAPKTKVKISLKKTKATAKPAIKVAAKPVPKVSKVPIKKVTAKESTTKLTSKATTKSTSKPAAKVVEHVAAKAAQKAAPKSISKSTRSAGLLTEAELLRQPKAEYMSKDQLNFFKNRLMQLQDQLRMNAGATTEHLRELAVAPDPADRATLEEEHALELRARDRERKLLKKVEAVLALIGSGEYGYCEETGEQIGIPRLLARPTATLTIEAQERRELKQKMYGE